MPHFPRNAPIATRAPVSLSTGLESGEHPRIWGRLIRIVSWQQPQIRTGLVARINGGFERIKITNPVVGAFFGYSYRPFARAREVANTPMSALIRCSAFCVFLVLRTCSVKEIGPAIIRSIPIIVVYFFGWPRPGHVEPRQPCRLIGPSVDVNDAIPAARTFLQATCDSANPYTGSRFHSPNKLASLFFVLQHFSQPFRGHDLLHPIFHASSPLHDEKSNVPHLLIACNCDVLLRTGRPRRTFHKSQLLTQKRRQKAPLCRMEFRLTP